MKHQKRAVFAALLTLALAVVLSAASPEAKPPAQVKTADFAWMTGRWHGQLQKDTAEQICSRPQHGEMLCLFRISDGQKYLMFELITLQETTDGLELRSLHFDPSLVQRDKVEPLVMKLAKYSATEVVFEGVPGSQVKHSTLLRRGADEMDGVIELVGQDDPHIRVHWTRQPY